MKHAKLIIISVFQDFLVFMKHFTSEIVKILKECFFVTDNRCVDHEQRTVWNLISKSSFSKGSPLSTLLTEVGKVLISFSNIYFRFINVGRPDLCQPQQSSLIAVKRRYRDNYFFMTTCLVFLIWP